MFMTEKIITDNAGEIIKISWDGERFAIIREIKRYTIPTPRKTVLVLNPREMIEIVQFAGSLGKGG